MKVSVCLLTIDRYQLTRYCLQSLLANCGIDRKDIELLILDNGSKDKRVIEYCKSIADIFIQEPTNIGVSKGFNKLFKKASGEFICTIGNDIAASKDWLKDLIHYNQTIKNSGIGAIYCLMDKGTYNDKLNVFIPSANLVYGIALWNKKLLDLIGGFDYSLTGYGYEDSQYCFRAFKTGHLNYYLANQYSTHLGEDVNQDSDYRKNKDNHLKKNLPIFQSSIQKMIQTNNYKIKL